MAGLRVSVSVASPGQNGRAATEQLAGFYEHYPASDGPSHVDLAVEQVADFTDGRVRGPEYPAFARRVVRPGQIELARFDAEGVLFAPSGDTEPVRGQFRVGPSKNSLEAVIRIAISVALPRRGGLLMHASAIELAGEAHIFAGVSGAGKSTISAMLAESLSACTRLSDELLILAPADEAHPGESARMAVHVTPFIGGHGLPHGRRAPARALYFLHQAPYHKRLAMSRTEGLRELMRHVLVYVAEPDTAGHVLAAAARATQSIPCHHLHFAKDPGVASVLAAT